jgi:hypothetical protein
MTKQTALLKATCLHSECICIILHLRLAHDPAVTALNETFCVQLKDCQLKFSWTTRHYSKSETMPLMSWAGLDRSWVK